MPFNISFPSPHSVPFQQQWKSYCYVLSSQSEGRPQIRRITATNYPLKLRVNDYKNTYRQVMGKDKRSKYQCRTRRKGLDAVTTAIISQSQPAQPPSAQFNPAQPIPRQPDLSQPIPASYTSCDPYPRPPPLLRSKKTFLRSECRIGSWSAIITCAITSSTVLSRWFLKTPNSSNHALKITSSPLFCMRLDLLPITRLTRPSACYFCE